MYPSSHVHLLVVENCNRPLSFIVDAYTNDSGMLHHEIDNPVPGYNHSITYNDLIKMVYPYYIQKRLENQGRDEQTNRTPENRDACVHWHCCNDQLIVTRK